MERRKLGQNLMVTVMILCLVSCQFVSCQPRNSSKTGRAISGSKPGIKESKVVEDDSEENINPDLAFDNSPFNESDIVFPDEGPTPSEPISTRKNSAKEPVAPRVNQNRWQKIPFKKLVELGKETDVLKVLEKYVANAKVSVDDKNNKILVDNDGNPLVNSANKTVIVAEAQKNSISFNNIIEPRLSSSGPSLRTSVSADGPMTRSFAPKQKPVAVSKQELCTTEKRAVPVELERPPHMIIIPRCVRVERCSGCCISELMECEPYMKDNVNFTIQKYAYTGDGDRPLEFVDNQVITVEQHLGCSCKCKAKATDCLPHHIYDESECSCKCKNTNDLNQCGKELNKIWDSTMCMCLCREEKECSSGLYFDYNTCGCERETDESLRSRAILKRPRKRNSTVKV